MISASSPTHGSSQPGEHCCDLRYWSTENVRPTRVLRFHSKPASDDQLPKPTAALWEFFEAMSADQYRMLLIDFPQDYFDHEGLVNLWEQLRGISQKSPNEARLELTRYDYAMQRLITCMCNTKYFVVGAFRGEVDINYLGLMLACDYCIVSNDTTIINKRHLITTGACTAAPWFLHRILGRTQTARILWECDLLSAPQAFEAGIVHHLTTSASHTKDALAAAQSLLSKGIPNLLAYKRAACLSSASLDEYLHTVGAGFKRFPINTPVCANCGYNLTGNITGNCPECGCLASATDTRAQTTEDWL